MDRKTLTVTDLFSGCGGLSLGFDYHDDFELVYALDKWDVACRSYRANFPGVDVDCRDALDMKPQDIPKADVIIGGPPCQEFSQAKETRRSYDMSLIEWFLSVIAFHKPKYWIMENVPAVRAFLPVLHSSKIYSMTDYGVPQLRKRCFTGQYCEPQKNPVRIKFPAVVATEYKGSPGNRKGVRLYSAFNRKALVLEAKLVQTFPLDYILHGSLQDRYIQIGNAVPPLMAYRFAEAIINPLQKKLVLEKGAS